MLLHDIGKFGINVRGGQHLLERLHNRHEQILFPYIGTVSCTGQLHVRLMPLCFVPRFVVVRFRHEDERLDTDEDLEQCALTTDPARTRPGT